MNRNRSGKSAATLPPLDEKQRRRAEEHLALAHQLAWKLFHSSSRVIPLDELRGEAMYALSYAAGMYDEAHGVPFGAYARMAITHRLINAVTVWHRGGRLAHVRFTDLTASRQTDFDTPCPREREPPDHVADRELIERLRQRLPSRWFKALRLYYALGCTLEEVGQRLGVTRERVRQLLIKAMARVRENGIVPLEPAPDFMSASRM